ncbi:serine protease [Sorangium sp. So ce134]
MQMDHRLRRVPIPQGEADSISRRREMALESLIGQNSDFLPVRFLEQGYRRSRAVARIQLRKATPEGPSAAGFGTGFLVAPGILMTNHHVLPDVEAASMSRAQFNYQVDLLGDETASDDWDLAPDRMFVTSPFEELDFTLVALAPKRTTEAGTVYGTIPLSGDPSKIKVGESVNIIQHPSGRRKEVVLHDNAVTGFFTGGYIHYTADTLVGSSGSPVFNNQWELVALHHRGVVKSDDRGLPLDERGEPIADGRRVIEANEGIRISAIVAYLVSERVPSGTRAALKPFLY